jgi:hypothetical protein
MKRTVIALFLSLVSLSAFGQSGSSVRQSGNVTQRHIACWTSNGIIQDCGTAATPFATSIGTVGQGPTICANSAAVTGPYNQICLSANTSSNAQITIQNYGGATAQGLDFNINGSVVSLPSSPGSNFVSSTGVLAGDRLASFNSSQPVIQDSGVAASLGIITGGAWQATPIDTAYGGTGATTAGGARTNLGLGSMSTQNSSGVAITGGTITGMPTPTALTDVAIKSYVDSLAAGLTVHVAVRLATATVLPGTPSYSNGASGVGATLTAGSNGALTVDSTSASSADRILVKNQASALQNGVYSVTTVGDGSNPYVLTRVTDFDQNTEMTQGSYFFTSAGATNLGSSYVLAASVATVGSSSVTFNQFSSTASVASGIDVGGATAISNGTSGRVLYDNAGVVGEKTVTGTGSVVLAAAPTITGHPTIEGVTSTGATGTGAFVFGTSPTIASPTITSPAISSPTITGTASFFGTSVNNKTGTGNMVLSASPTLTGTLSSGSIVATSAAAFGLTAGPNGTTNPTFNVNTGAGSATTGVQVVGLSSGNGAYIQTTSPFASENLAIDAKGSGLLVLGGANGASESIVIGATTSQQVSFGANFRCSYTQLYSTGDAGWCFGASINATDVFYVFGQSSTQGVYLPDGGISWVSASDERLKTILSPITGASDSMSKFRTVRFRYKTDADKISRLGLIAQDVEKVYPECVTHSGPKLADGSPALGLAYDCLVPALVEAVRELKTRLDAREGKRG